MDGSLVLWKRMLFIAIGVVAAAGVLVILYFSYETYSIGKKGPMPASDQPQTPAEQQRAISSLTAPAQAASSAPAAAPSGEPARGTAPQAPKPPSALTAPAASSGQSAQSQGDKAVIDSLTAPH